MQNREEDSNINKSIIFSKSAGFTPDPALKKIAFHQQESNRQRYLGCS